MDKHFENGIFFSWSGNKTHISEVPKLLSAPSNSLTTKIFRIGLKISKCCGFQGIRFFWRFTSLPQVVGISGAMDYVITPEGSQFSCEHGVAPLGFWAVTFFFRKIIQTSFFCKVRNLEISFKWWIAGFLKRMHVQLWFILKLYSFPFNWGGTFLSGFFFKSSPRFGWVRFCPN